MLYLHYTRTIEEAEEIILCEIDGPPERGKQARMVRKLRGKAGICQTWPIINPKLYYPLTDLQKIELL